MPSDQTFTLLANYLREGFKAVIRTATSRKCTIAYVVIAYLAVEIMTPFPSFIRQFIADARDKETSCGMEKEIDILKKKFRSYFGDMPPDREVIKYFHANRTGLERLVRIYYATGGPPWANQDLTYHGMLKELCLRRYQWAGSDPKPKRRLPDGKPGHYADVIEFNIKLFEPQERRKYPMRNGKSLIYWPEGEFSDIYKSCDSNSLENFTNKDPYERVLGEDRCCKISGLWNLCVLSIN